MQCRLVVVAVGGWWHTDSDSDGVEDVTEWLNAVFFLLTM